MYEIAARKVVNPATETGKTFSWGVPATKERVESFFLVSNRSYRKKAILKLREIKMLTLIRTMTLVFERH